jgi:hypothetical protein
MVYDGGEPYAYVVPDATADGVQNPQNSGISSQTASMQRACYLADPTAYPSYWRSGQYDSPGDNSVIIFGDQKSNGQFAWYKTGAKHNNHIKELDCSTNATADTSLSASQTSIQPGESTTLTWASQYGKLRQATCTGTNFTTDTTVPGHFETVLVTNPICSGGGNPFNQPQANSASVPANRLTAGCAPYLGQQWVPTYTGSAPYGGSKDVSPTETTTYTYTCTNANGSSSASVTVYVGGGQCSDGTDNDHDGLIDSQDPGCAFSPPGSPGNPGGTPSESGDMPDLVASAISPSTVTSGHPVTLSSTITNQGGSGTVTGFKNLFQIDNDADHSTVTASLTDTSPALGSVQSDVSQITYTFPTEGTWYMRACADNDESWKGTVNESNEGNNCSAGGWTEITVGVQGASLSANPQKVVYNNPTTLIWECGTANSASIDNGVGDVSPAAGGHIDTANILQTTTYTLSCIGAQLKKAYATVEVLPPQLTLTVSPAFVRPGGSVTITWSATAGAKGCTVSGWGLDTSHSLSDSAVVTDIKNAHTYTFSCNGSGSKSATVNILPNYREK